ncbi:hypothetical protein BVI1335_720017 [Burkholderia vietnamiensis]|nr:hypothetical protein BVI1335_720017 [Burkholderia vietnamiensis]
MPPPAGAHTRAAVKSPLPPAPVWRVIRRSTADADSQGSGRARAQLPVADPAREESARRYGKRADPQGARHRPGLAARFRRVCEADRQRDRRSDDAGQDFRVPDAPPLTAAHHAPLTASGAGDAPASRRL